MIVALVPDLMDRSRVSGAIADVRFVRNPADCAGATVVIVDLARHADDVAAARVAAPAARIVAFGAHVDNEALERAVVDGANAALPRSQFFRDPATAIGG